MAKLEITIKPNGAPHLIVRGSGDTVGDLQRLFKKAAAELQNGVRVFREFKDHKVLGVTIKPE